MERSSSAKKDKTMNTSGVVQIDADRLIKIPFQKSNHTLSQCINSNQKDYIHLVCIDEYGDGGSSPLHGYSFELADSCDWVIVQDEGALRLVPLRKAV